MRVVKLLFVVLLFAVPARSQITCSSSVPKDVCEYATGQYPRATAVLGAPKEKSDPSDIVIFPISVVTQEEYDKFLPSKHYLETVRGAFRLDQSGHIIGVLLSTDLFYEWHLVVDEKDSKGVITKSHFVKESLSMYSISDVMAFIGGFTTAYFMACH